MEINTRDAWSSFMAAPDALLVITPATSIDASGGDPLRSRWRGESGEVAADWKIRRGFLESCTMLAG
jgi:hypothetical protein